MRLIDADSLKEGIKELKRSPWYNNDINPSWRQGIKDAVHVIETLCIDKEPTVYALPVIRCRDCKHYTKEGHVRCWNPHGMHPTDPDEYCSRAERIEDWVK